MFGKFLKNHYTSEIKCSKYAHINLACNQIKIPLKVKFNYKIGCHQFVVFAFSTIFFSFLFRALFVVICILNQWHWHTIDTECCRCRGLALKDELYEFQLQSHNNNNNKIHNISTKNVHTKKMYAVDHDYTLTVTCSGYLGIIIYFFCKSERTKWHCLTRNCIVLSSI